MLLHSLISCELARMGGTLLGGEKVPIGNRGRLCSWKEIKLSTRRHITASSATFIISKLILVSTHNSLHCLQKNIAPWKRCCTEFIFPRVLAPLPSRGSGCQRIARLDLKMGKRPTVNVETTSSIHDKIMHIYNI